MLIRTRLTIIITAALILGGCGQTSITPSQDPQSPINTPQGMVEYLDAQNLPALESAQPWQNQFAPGIEISTPHYRIYTTLLEPLILNRLPGFMESAYAGYQKQLPRPIDTKSKFTIYLFSDRQQWEKKTIEVTGPQAPIYLKIKVGAYYLNGDCIAYHIGTDKTLSVLGHEGWHQFNSRHFKFRLVSFLDEGIAMQFESYVCDKGLFRFEPNKNLRRLGQLRKTIIENKMIPLAKLLTMDPGQALSAGDDTVAAYYSQSYALIRFLREDNYNQRLNSYYQLLLGALRGTWPINDDTANIAANRNIPLTVNFNRIAGPAVFQYYINPDLEKIEAQYRNYCRKIVYHVRLKN